MAVRILALDVEVDGNKYYEMFDRDTYHTLKFGQTKKDGSLFPRRKDADGNWLDDGGWTKYNPMRQM